MDGTVVALIAVCASLFTALVTLVIARRGLMTAEDCERRIAGCEKRQSVVGQNDKDWRMEFKTDLGRFEKKLDDGLTEVYRRLNSLDIAFAKKGEP